MGLFNLHPTLKATFPLVICTSPGKVQVVLVDSAALTYTTTQIGAEGHRDNVQEVGAFNADSGDELQVLFDPVTNADFHCPKPSELAKHILVDSLELDSWKPDTLVIHTDRGNKDHGWKARKREQRAQQQVKRATPYPQDDVVDFTDDAVINAKGEHQTRFPLRGDRLMADRNHRQALMKYLLDFAIRYDWPAGCNYMFRFQGFEPHVILANPDEPIVLDDTTEFAEADYEVPYMLKQFYVKMGKREFIVYSKDSDLILILLAVFFDQLSAPMGVEHGDHGAQIYLFRGRLPKDKDGNDQPAYIDMRRLASELRARDSTPSLFCSTAILLHDSDYFSKKWATSYINYRVGYLYMSHIAAHFKQVPGGFDWRKFAHIKRLLHCLLHCHDHYSSITRKLRPKCGWKAKKLKITGAAESKDEEDGEDDGIPMHFDPVALQRKTSSAILTAEQVQQMEQDDATRTAALNQVFREISDFRIPSFQSLETTADVLMGEGKKRKKKVPNWIQNAYDIEKTFSTLISELDREDARKKEEDRKRRESNASAKKLFAVQGSQTNPIYVTGDSDVSNRERKIAASWLEAPDEETKVPRPVESIARYMEVIGEPFMRNHPDQRVTATTVEAEDPHDPEGKIALLTVSPVKDAYDRMFDSRKKALLREFDCTPWEMFNVFSLMIHNLEVLQHNPFKDGKRLPLK